MRYAWVPGRSNALLICFAAIVVYKRVDGGDRFVNHLLVYGLQLFLNFSDLALSLFLHSLPLFWLARGVRSWFTGVRLLGIQIERWELVKLASVYLSASESRRGR